MGRRSGAPLTQEQVNRLKPGQVLNDGRVPGLGVRRGEDRLTWRLKVQVAKAGIRYTTKAGDERVRQFRVETLNPVGDMTLAEARERAEIVKGKIKSEIRDPETLRRRANATEITLKQAWDRYVEGRKVRRFDKNGVEVQKPLSPKSIRDLEDTLRLYFGDWQDRTLAVLSEERDTFEARFYDLTNTRGGRTANKAVQHFRAVWREAKGKLPDLPSCPADTLTKLNSESERKSAYQPEELPNAVKAVWKAGRFRAGVHLFLMLTGQRSGAVKRAKRDQYHRDEGYLDLLDDKGQSHPVPLSPVLIDLLDAMIKLGDRHFAGTAFIFPAHSKKGHVTDVRIDAPASALMAAHRATIGRGIGSEIGGHTWRHTWRSLYPVAGLIVRDRERLEKTLGRALTQSRGANWWTKAMRADFADTAESIHIVFHAMVSHARSVTLDLAMASVGGSVRWVSVLDGKTTAVCRSRSGKIYAPGVGPRPPAHVRCRSIVVPHFPGKGEFEEPTYSEWLKKQTPDRVRQILGKTKGDMFLRGELSLEDMVTAKGRELTLKELADRKQKRT